MNRVLIIRQAHFKHRNELAIISGNLRLPMCLYYFNNLFLSHTSNKNVTAPSKINNSKKLISRGRTKFLWEIPASSLSRPFHFAIHRNPVRIGVREHIHVTCRRAQMCVLSRHSREKTPWRNNWVVCNARWGIVRGCKRQTWWGKKGKRDAKEDEKEEEEEKEEKK